MGQQKSAPEGGTRESERRRTILRAAIDVFARKGYHGCRIADVAKEAGVAYGLVYHYFKNKDELLETVFETGWSGFISRARLVAESEGPLEEKVRRIADVAFEAYRVDPRAVKVLILEIARSPAGARINRQTAFVDVIRLSAQMFTRAKESGELRPDVDPLLASALLFGSIEMGLTAFVVGLADARDTVMLERAKAQIADSFLHGVLVPGGAPSRTEPPRSELSTAEPVRAEEPKHEAPAEVSTWKREKSGTKSKAPKRS
ncbi:TetR/AcrR family transcriptional regulator [Corallococcus praedator]|uniref:TetR/AcrR family transcriptional regulator n=1 Tax=Corallococcus praedator TaxID=2316724 RepID=A0ABX9QPY5_9BACT|nr:MULTISPECIES: TetR/AcrR family transcriptional regulator [Corallococcus]RKH19500.1 TetR/AcrR family transcriptional regulator [Corallococcus sp. CA047B]RKH33823.1 TetR/AcrR family transcriptional regulator [Corallococcus sp. CA031C]RKI15095.1 TetR/AcrR family transcriptional regulator [Corallococcus praedator]